jgi:hypothetical protein
MLQTAQAENLQVIGALTQIRKEWQGAANGISLLDVKGTVGLILADMLNHLHLSADLQVQVLGHDLFQELQEFLSTSDKN